MKSAFFHLDTIMGSTWDNAKGYLRDELERLQAGLNTWSDKEHNADGTHKDVTADSVSVQGFPIGVPENAPIDAARFYTYGGGTWTVTPSNVLYLRKAHFGQFGWVEFYITGSTITVDSPDNLIVAIPELSPLDVPRNAADSFAAYHHSGNFHAVDIDNGNSYSGYIIAKTVDVNGRQAAGLYLGRDSDAQFPVTAELNVYGHAMFPLNPNNQQLVF